MHQSRRTEGNLRQGATEESQDNFDLLLKHAPAAIAMFDREMRYMAASRRWVEDYRLETEDLVGHSHYEIFPEIPDRWKAIHRRCLNGAIERNDRDCFPRADGTIDWVRWEVRPWTQPNGEIGGVVMFTEVITDRVESEEIIRRYRDIVENIQTGLFVFCLGYPAGDATLRLVAANAAAEELTGRGSPELLGKTIDETFPTLRQEGVLQEFAEVARSRRLKEFPDFEFDSASSKMWRFKAFPLPGQCVGVAVEDVTERKRLQESLLQGQKMEILGRMAGGIAHDFKNTLTVALGFCELARMGHNVDSMLGHLQEAMEDANRISDRLLTFARDRPRDIEPLDLNEIVESSTQMMAMLVGRGVETQLRLARGLPPIVGNQDEVRQIVMNLASNAGDAMDGQGVLTVSTAETEMSETVEELGFKAAPGRYVVLGFSDTGSGIEPADLEHIFEPFFTTKAEGKGTGLGLACVYGAVKRAGGFVRVESAPGRGSRFSLFWPVS